MYQMSFQGDGAKASSSQAGRPAPLLFQVADPVSGNHLVISRNQFILFALCRPSQTCVITNVNKFALVNRVDLTISIVNLSSYRMIDSKPN